jgi:TonB family protein
MAVVHNAAPKLMMEPSLVAAPDIVLPNVNVAQIGLPNGVPGPPSNGPGSGGGIGTGDGGGAGPGSGPGYGPGRGPGGATVLAGQRGAVTPASVLWKVEPEYTDEARKVRLQGTVVLYIEVSPDGKAQNLRVGQGLGLGLDERAIEAVRRWRFRPGYENGKPVLTTAQVLVSFRLL